MKASFALPMTPRPPGLILGHLQEDGSLRPIEGKYYRSGDAVRRSPDGVFTYIGLRLPHQPVRTGERTDRARGSCRGRRRTQP
jgi:hypothetical protein